MKIREVPEEAPNAAPLNLPFLLKNYIAPKQITGRTLVRELIV